MSNHEVTSAVEWPDYDYRRAWAIRMVDLFHIAERHQLSIRAELRSEEDLTLTFEGMLRGSIYFIVDGQEFRGHEGDLFRFTYDLADEGCGPMSPKRLERFRNGSCLAKGG